MFSQITCTFRFDTVKIHNWPAIHSFSYALYDSYVLIIGGRTDGMHGKENGFENKNSNTTIYLWNYLNDSITSYHPDSLTNELKDYLSASNANFTQDSQSLYIMGGYAQSSSGVYKTYPVLMKINLKECIESILLNKDIRHSITYTVADEFAVAGAQLKIIDSLFYLTGGHKFDGKYSSDDHKIKQTYTDALRIYKFSDDGDSIKYTKLKEIVNDEIFHRRDFNLNRMISEDGKIKLMVFGGVFQYNVGRAFLNTALLYNQDYQEIFDFEHKYASYHCSRVGLFDALNNEMHYLFFGGMAEYYRDSLNEISRDPYVPFVKSVSCLTRKSDGKFVEIIYPDSLPGYFGSNSEFLINPSLNLRYQDIIDYNSIQKDTTLLGTIFGGIYNPSKFRNAWQQDSAHLTISNPYLIRVQLLKKNTTATLNSSKNEFENKTSLIPNPAKNQVRIVFPKETQIESVHLIIKDVQGHSLKNLVFNSIANNELILSTKELIPQNYILNFLLNGKIIVRKSLSIY